MAIINIGEGNWADIRAKINAMNTELYSHIGDSPTYIIGEGDWSTIRANINSMYQELVLAMTLTTTTTTTTTTTAPTTTSSGAYSSEYQTVYNAMTTKPSGGVADAQNTMVESMVTAGIWTKFDVFYMFAQESNTAGEALINWKSPGTYNADNVSSTAWNTLEGFTGDGNLDYISTNWNASINGVNFTQNSACLGVYVRNEINANQAAAGTVATNYTVITPRYVGGFYGGINSAGMGSNFTVASSLGLSTICRPNSTTLSFFRNSTYLGDVSDNSTAVPNGELYILDRSGDPRTSAYQVSVAFAGANLTNAEMTTLNNAIETYMDYNGKGVEPIVYTDSFDSYSAGDLNGNGFWVNCLGTMAIVDVSGDKCIYPSNGDYTCILYNKTFSNDQYSEATVQMSAQNTTWVGVAVRLTGSGGTSNGYEWIGEQNVSNIRKVTNGSVSTIVWGAGFVDGDVIRLEVTGTTFKAYRNGVLDTSMDGDGIFTDATFSTGKAGIGGYGSASDGNKIRTWNGGDL